MIWLFIVLWINIMRQSMVEITPQINSGSMILDTPPHYQWLMDWGVLKICLCAYHLKWCVGYLAVSGGPLPKHVTTPTPLKTTISLSFPPVASAYHLCPTTHTTCPPFHLPCHTIHLIPFPCYPSTSFDHSMFKFTYQMNVIHLTPLAKLTHFKYIAPTPEMVTIMSWSPAISIIK